MMEQFNTTVCIVGAGPAGTITSMFLAKFGIGSLLVDKTVFPRDKICGDAIGFMAIEVLNKLMPEIVTNLIEEEIRIVPRGVKIVAPNLKEIELPFIEEHSMANKLTGFISKRFNFDNFLVDQAKTLKDIRILEGYEVDFYQRSQNGWLLRTKDKRLEIRTKLLIIADGAYSHFAHHIGNIKMEQEHYCAGVRGYYNGVTNLGRDNFMEVHFLRELLPGYLWIFPLPNGLSNVGIGMRSDIISKNKINLREKLREIIDKYPTLQTRFKNSELIGELKGHGLPIGSKYRKISGSNYMLVGDAASLINPFTGEGIGVAMRTGMLAAYQAQVSIRENDFSESFLRRYEIAVYKELQNELNFSLKIRRLAKLFWIINFVVGKANRNKLLTDAMSNMFININVRNQFRNPFFYLKLLFSNR